MCVFASITKLPTGRSSSRWQRSLHLGYFFRSWWQYKRRCNGQGCLWPLSSISGPFIHGDRLKYGELFSLWMSMTVYACLHIHVLSWWKVCHFSFFVQQDVIDWSQDDVRVMAKLQVKAYRFSISWSRILPCGQGNVNQAGNAWLQCRSSSKLIQHHRIHSIPLLHHQEGINFYSELIDCLLEAGLSVCTGPFLIFWCSSLTTLTFFFLCKALSRG